MIYIVGYVFQFNSRPLPQPSKMSLQGQMALAKKQPIAPKTTSPFDSRFIHGNAYRVARIREIKENDITRVQYLFANMSAPSLPDIDITFDNTAKGDEYIAAISGKIQQLEDERQLIDSSYILDNDI
jgi:hypothetical protein